MTEDFSKLPRLYTGQNLALNAPLVLEPGPAHYFRTVLRRQEGDRFRVFNGRDGEFLAEIITLGKKDGAAVLKEKIKPQPPKSSPLHLLFAPIKKQRMDFLIEKAVELGATDLHPILTNRTEVRKINEERIQAQIIEASEQCERMDVPVLHSMVTLKQKLAGNLPVNPVIWCAERFGAPHISAYNGELKAFLIGPEGGFDDDEGRILGNTPGIQPVSLGNTVYRCETAASLCLSLVRLKNPA